MPDKFDPYREALIVEINTVWPPEYDDVEFDEKARIETTLHEDPENCSILDYVRVHTGFCRQVTVTDEDLRRASD